MLARDLFISHSSDDAEVARELRGLLEQAGYTCWMAPDDVTGTDSWAKQIIAAITATRAMVVLVSSHANASAHVAREVELANGRKRAVLPIRIEPFAPTDDLEYHLAGRQRLDAFPPPISAHINPILRRLAGMVPLEPKAAGPTPTAEPATEVLDTGSAVAGPAGLATDLIAPEPFVPGIGARIGGFTLESVLGEGGMGTVYRATQDEPRRAVAIKLIRSDHTADESYHRRFLAEKDTLAGLEHPSIVPIYAAGEAAGQLFIALRLVDGPDLAARLAKAGRLSLAETVTILGPIADAIDYAHEMGIVHRDLKPSNILLDRKGRPYLTDFGLGKSFDRLRDLSAPGAGLGTLAYMAPEQFSGEVDPELAGRIDVYALGCVAYACLTGQPPYRADEPQQVMFGHVQGPIPDLSVARPDLPAAVGAAIRRALAKQAGDRYATASAFLATLAAAADVSDDKTAPLPPFPGARRSGLSAWARANSMLAGSVATLGALVLIAAVALAIGQPSASQLPGPGNSKAADVSSGPSPSPAPDPATGAPTEPTDSDAPPTPSPSPSPAPTPTPMPSPSPRRPPTQPPDKQPPTGAGISINGSSLKTSKEVNLTLQAHGATQMRLGRAASQTATCSWDDWRAYDPSISSFDLKGGGDAGKRWVCVEFRDAAGNPAPVVRDSVTFDNPPVANTSVRFKATCNGVDATYHLLDGGAPYVASDKDGRSTLSLVSAWATSPNDGTRVDFTSGITADRNSIRAWFAAGPDWIIHFIVQDTYGADDEGSFRIDCAPWNPP